MKKIILCCLFVLLSFVMSSCSMSKNFDCYEFCDRLNSMKNEIIISPDSYFKTQSTNEFNYFITSTHGRMSEITLTEDDIHRVCAVQLIITYNKTEISTEERNEILSLFEALCAVLTSQKSENISTLISTNGISPELIDFKSNNLQFTLDNTKYSLFANEEIMMLCCEKV